MLNDTNLDCHIPFPIPINSSINQSIHPIVTIHDPARRPCSYITATQHTLNHFLKITPLRYTWCRVILVLVNNFNMLLWNSVALSVRSSVRCIAEIAFRFSGHVFLSGAFLQTDLIPHNQGIFSHCFETEAYKDTKIKHAQTNMSPKKKKNKQTKLWVGTNETIAWFWINHLFADAN